MFIWQGPCFSIRMVMGSFVLMLSICPTQPIFTNTETAVLSNQIKRLATFSIFFFWYWGSEPNSKIHLTRTFVLGDHASAKPGVEELQPVQEASEGGAGRQTHAWPWGGDNICYLVYLDFLIILSILSIWGVVVDVLPSCLNFVWQTHTSPWGDSNWDDSTVIYSECCL